MITRIQTIKDYRIFRDFVWPSQGLSDFCRYNVIYGWNATGKTTLSTLFRHVQSGEQIVDGEMTLAINGKTLNVNRLTPADRPSVRVFNRDFVKRSVFESPTKRGLISITSGRTAQLNSAASRRSSRIWPQLDETLPSGN
jgi:wobble nucleotide-excising tRNase